MKKLFKNRKSQLSYLLFLTVYLLLLNSHPVDAQVNLKNLVKQVQTKNREFYSNINSVKFTGKSKSYAYFNWPVIDFQMIPVYQEYIFEGMWIKPDSLRIIVKAVRDAGLDTLKERRISEEKPLPNPFQFSYNVSAMGHDKEIYLNDKGEKSKMWPVSPFAPGADSIYNYKLLGDIRFNSKQVHLINVTPKFQDIPSVSGSFMIDPVQKVVVGSNVSFNDAVQTRKTKIERLSKDKKMFGLMLLGGIKEDRRVRTKKALLHSWYWLPYIIEEEFYVTLLGIKAKGLTTFEFDSYILNPDKTETVTTENKRIVYNIDSDLEKELVEDPYYLDRLTKKEIEKISSDAEDYFAGQDITSELISAETIAGEAFKLRVSEFRGENLKFLQNLGDKIIYNRVEGLRINYGITVSNPVIKNLIFSVSGGYGFADSRLKGETVFFYTPFKKKNIFLEFSLFDKINFMEENRLITTGKNTLTTFFAHSDYRDYYYKKGSCFALGFYFTDNSAFKLTYISQLEKEAQNNTDFSLFKWNKPFRRNPEITEGNYIGIQAKFLYNSKSLTLNLTADYTDKSYFKGDFSFSQLKVDINWNYNISYHHKLNLFLTLGSSKGALPPQRWFDFSGKTFINYSGNLRGTGYKYFTGDRTAAGIIEYSILFSDLYEFAEADAEGIENNIKLVFWTGFGWSRLSAKSKLLAEGLNIPQRTTDGIYREFGIGISDRFNICRLDFIRNSISDKKILFSINFLR